MIQITKLEEEEAKMMEMVETLHVINAVKVICLIQLFTHIKS